MGADIKNLRTRIKSVSSTLHLTTAMGLVASSKIRKATLAMQNGREYCATLFDVVELLCGNRECQKSPYMRKASTQKTKLIVVAGDRGLAGGYNANIFRLVKQYGDAEIIPIGKRACDRFGEGFLSAENFSYKDAGALAANLCAQFAAGDFDRLGVICTKYISMMSLEAVVEWILPLSPTEKTAQGSIVFEPNERQVLDQLIPEYVAGRLVGAVRESFACEVAARRTAMDSAGKNAQEMLDDLQLSYNRARQGAITQEITEIVAGSDL